MHTTLDLDQTPPFEIRAVPQDASQPIATPFRDRLLVLTVHDGHGIPERYLTGDDGTPLIDPAELARRFVAERDWGANLVAHKIARELGLPGYGRVNVARVLLDFNRFPGSTPPGDFDLLERLAIHGPFARSLDHRRKMALLEEGYDEISNLLEEVVVDRLVQIGVHTYDVRNASRTMRPDLSLISRAASYQQESRLPYGVFDPSYPDILAESSCSRVLRDRVSIDLERAGFRVSHNHPYPHPVGSLEVRSQVWNFFRFVRERFERERPDSRTTPAYRLVWTMLLNTNLRLQEAEVLRGYLHRYRRTQTPGLEHLKDAQSAYEEVREFIEESPVLSDYRRRVDRPSALALEVRKDLVCAFDPETGRPNARTDAMEETSDRIARALAGAIRTFLLSDREASGRTQAHRRALPQE